MIIAITGTPGTGKTAVAELLARKTGWKLVKLNELAKEKDFYSGYDPVRHVPIIDVKKLKVEVRKMKGNLILEAHYSHEFPSDLVIVLRANPGVLRERMEKKGWRAEKVEENVQAEIMEECKTEALELGRKVREIDTTRTGPEKVVEEILKILRQ